MRRLLIRPGAIGDCILSLPVLQYLTASYTEVWISTPAVPLVQFADQVAAIASTGLDLVGVGDLEMPASLRKRLESFDSIISWYGSNRPPLQAVLQSLKVPCEFHPALPPSNYSDHATDFFARQVGAPDGLLPQIICGSPQRETIIVHPYSGSARKNWPLRSFIELASQLPYPVEWSVGPEEELPAELKPMRFASLIDLAARISGARLYIGNDSGITHLAAAAGTPTLALFGPTNPDVWAPRGTNVTVLRNTSLAELSVQAVLETANRLLN